MDSFLKFEKCLLETLQRFNERDECCDLEVHCSDGKIFIHGLVFAYLSPYILSEMKNVDDFCVILPDISSQHLITFLRCLLNSHGQVFPRDVIHILTSVGRVIGLSPDIVGPADQPCEDVAATPPPPPPPSQFTSARLFNLSPVSVSSSAGGGSSSRIQLAPIAGQLVAPLAGQLAPLAGQLAPVAGLLPPPVAVFPAINSLAPQLPHTDSVTKAVNVIELPESTPELSSTVVSPPKRARALEPTVVTTPTSTERDVLVYDDLSNMSLFFDEKSTKMEKKCLLSLAKVNVDSITDDVLCENFGDQEGRLVCLVCYKILRPDEFRVYRNHLREHDLKQLDKVTIIVPDVGRGGPGLKKTQTSDAGLERKYCDPTGQFLVCKKCGKTYTLSQKTGFRKHLNYHNHKEKNYVYVCAQCSKVFSDHSNLKRHIHSMHDKQVFRCLHCDFEDKRKRKLEEHLMKVHKEKVGYLGEISLNKGSGQEAIADLSASEPPLPAAQSDHQENHHKVYSYKCSGCGFKSRRQDDLEAHLLDETAHVGIDTGELGGGGGGGVDPAGVLPLTIKKIALKPREPRVKPFACKLCPQRFTSDSLLSRHLAALHNVLSGTGGSGSGGGGIGGGGEVVEYRCGECGVKCANLPGLKAHERSHLEKTHTCSTCGKSFLVWSLLRDHVEKGSCKLENKTCPICSKVFADKKRKQIHMKTHYNDKAFACNICGKAFVQKRSLKEHQLTHETVRHFQCRHCGKKFVQNNHLRYHLTSQHPDQIGDSMPRHNCRHCAKSFPFAYQLRRHERVHSGPGGSAAGGGGGLTSGGLAGAGSLQCEACLHWFVSPNLLQEHRQQCFVYSDVLGKSRDDANTAAGGIVHPTQSLEGIRQGEDEEDESMEQYEDVRWHQPEIVIHSDNLDPPSDCLEDDTACLDTANSCLQAGRLTAGNSCLGSEPDSGGGSSSCLTAAEVELESVDCLSNLGVTG